MEIKKSIPQAAYTTVTMYACRAVIFLHFRMLLFFGLMSYQGKIAYLNSPNREFSNGAQAMELY